MNGKAGNLNHALREVFPRGAPVHPGEVVAVFDCDQARARCTFLSLAHRLWPAVVDTTWLRCLA